MKLMEKRVVDANNLPSPDTRFLIRSEPMYVFIHRVVKNVQILVTMGYVCVVLAMQFSMHTLEVAELFVCLYRA